MTSGRWRQPSDALLADVVPFLRDPVDFCLTEAQLRFNWCAQLVEFPSFRLYRGNKSAERPLPWLDADKQVFIAINRIPGDDVAIALDYRTSFADPHVVASEWSDDGFSNWRKVSSTFSAFFAAVRL